VAMPDDASTISTNKRFSNKYLLSSPKSRLRNIHEKLDQTKYHLITVNRKTMKLLWS